MSIIETAHDSLRCLDATGADTMIREELTDVLGIDALAPRSRIRAQ